MATKTRTPKNKKTTKKTETNETKSRKKRTMASPENISAALSVYSAARCSVDEARFTVNALEGIGEVHASEVVTALKKVRIGLKAIRSARTEITSKLKKNAWVKAMLDHLELWEEDLDNLWENAQDILKD